MPTSLPQPEDAGPRVLLQQLLPGVSSQEVCPSLRATSARGRSLGGEGGRKALPEKLSLIPGWGGGLLATCPYP